ncbi:MAG: hypothetical protein D6737_02775 [Chloroflexi bacterium]|nr:MAG: hypothetical protein D6737_02775 [Chloroflexota bacterium]
MSAAIIVLFVTIIIGHSTLYAQDNEIDPSLMPRYGIVELESGFSPDPYELEIVAFADAGYDIESLVDGDCGGYVGGNPDLIVDWQEATDNYLSVNFFPDVLDISLIEDRSAMVIRAPDGRWYCASGRVPEILVRDVIPGMYMVWTGTREHGVEIEGTLTIEELTTVSEVETTSPVNTTSTDCNITPILSQLAQAQVSLAAANFDTALDFIAQAEADIDALQSDCDVATSNVIAETIGSQQSEPEDEDENTDS